MIKSYLEFQLMYLYLDEYYDENPSENLLVFVSDYNPDFWAAEMSADPAEYAEFKRQYYKYENHDDYSYEFICLYLKNVDYYQEIYEIFTEKGKDDYMEFCKDILENYRHFLKEPPYDMFRDYQFMYLVIKSIYKENRNSDLKQFLKDANPYTLNGYTLDNPVYKEFKKKYGSSENHDYNSYESVMNFLNSPKYESVYKFINKLSKEEYEDSIDNMRGKVRKIYDAKEFMADGKAMSFEEWKQYVYEWLEEN